MVNSVRSQPNHYQTLGLSPTATDDEISQAFERKLSDCRWHPMGTSAAICIAYETLSNRFKRADYDRSHGLEPKPQPRLSTMTVRQERWAPFIASTAMNALGEAARDAGTEPHVTARRDSEGREEPKPRSLIAASVRELARPRPRADSFDGRPQQQQHSRPQARVDPELRQMLATQLPDRTSARDFEDRLFDWKRPALALGGFVFAAGLIGVVAGLSLKGDEGSARAAAPANVTAPSPRIHAAAAAPSPAPMAATVETHAERPVRFATSVARTKRAISRHHARSWVRRRAHKGQPSESKPANATPPGADQLATDPPISQPQ